MDTTRGEAKEANGCENHKAIVEEEEEERESQCLLPPPRKGGMSRSTDKVKRTVQWTDNKGDNLAEVLVYEPSEVSDSDDDDSDACICAVINQYL
ncbi:uncharacterized protein LOC106437797 isoform X1 [Brassica napus]|uniref:uncharacterized protein LOC106437797 isoform X1 n=1 Tax=Brassica napus TaxID=3708 RepID=UPI0006AB5B07|nr:uncharacterized protein LOC106437797 isoform X1 [Brassica napus]XP_013734228.1 uncharacterized protein LOC106437797 isoform X1 [Brassica napus]